MRQSTYSKSCQLNICLWSIALIKADSSAIKSSSLSPEQKKGLSLSLASMIILRVAGSYKKLHGLIFSQIASILSSRLSLTVSAKPFASLVKEISCFVSSAATTG